MSKGSGFATGHKESVGKGAHANMPQETKIQNYPKGSSYPGGDMDDTMTGIDKVNSATVSRASKHKSNQK
jgi:hypothetical protein